MIGANFLIKKGTVFVYRAYDIAHEIELKKAQSILEQSSIATQVRRYQLKKDPIRTIVMREAPLILSGDDDLLKIDFLGEKREFKYNLEVKIWDYGVVSFSYKIDVGPDLKWKDLVLLGSILDSDSVVDEISKKKKDELTQEIYSSLKHPFNHEVFEDYTIYLIEEIEDKTSAKQEKLSLPTELIKLVSVPELLLAEPNRTLSESTRKSVLSNYNQYTKKDLLIVDWNSSLILDFTKEKEYQEYVDVIEVALTQILELRIYDQLLDERLDELYNSIETNQHNKISDFYSKLATEASQLYLEFSDFFERIDNSIKTVGDFYSAKVLKLVNKKLGFDELKLSMLRKIDTLSKISSMLQSKVDALIDENRNRIGEDNISKSHRMEFAILIMILIESLPTINKIFKYILSLL